MRYIFTSLFLLFGVGIFAQTGKVTGKVTSGKTGEALIGATVTIEGLNRATATDLNGVYTISNLNAGTYAVSASFVSYS
ncbi:MAG: carboxypeptidase-like regulatory domain-containing protein [Segetibacter sp.]